MKFKMIHIFLTKQPESFDENTPPDWLVCKENKWFYDAHVKTLGVGESIDTDFRTIMRVE